MARQITSFQLIVGDKPEIPGTPDFIKKKYVVADSVDIELTKVKKVIVEGVVDFTKPLATIYEEQLALTKADENIG